jgi:hypothetical protein
LLHFRELTNRLAVPRIKPARRIERQPRQRFRPLDPGIGAPDQSEIFRFQPRHTELPVTRKRFDGTILTSDRSLQDPMGIPPRFLLERDPRQSFGGRPVPCEISPLALLDRGRAARVPF